LSLYRDGLVAYKSPEGVPLLVNGGVFIKPNLALMMTAVLNYLDRKKFVTHR